MPLPRITAPEFDVTLLSHKKPVHCRPYLVKEEKLLLMAQQSGDEADVRNAVKQVIRNCTFDKIDADKIPSFDIEFLFLRLRARSVSNKVDVRFQCQNPVDGKPCGQHVPVSVNLDEVQLTVPQGHTNKFMLTKDIGVTLRYPTVSLLSELGDNPPVLDVLAQCIETIFTANGDVTETKDVKFSEVQGFVDTLHLSQTDDLKRFFTTMPRLEYTIQFECPKCHFKEQIVLTGLLDFFD